jgi:hypothetical protein
MKFQRNAAVAALGLLVSGCASIVGGGTSQELSVMTDPPGATCVFYRQGASIGTVQSTPGNLVVKRRKYDITIKCDKAGYAQAEYLNHSGLSSMVAGNVAADLVLTAGLSSIIDSANGADNEYTKSVMVGLKPLNAASADTASATAAAPVPANMVSPATEAKPAASPATPAPPAKSSTLAPSH